MNCTGSVWLGGTNTCEQERAWFAFYVLQHCTRKVSDKLARANQLTTDCYQRQEIRNTLPFALPLPFAWLMCSPALIFCCGYLGMHYAAQLHSKCRQKSSPPSLLCSVAVRVARLHSSFLLLNVGVC